MELSGALIFATLLNLCCLASLRETADPKKTVIRFYYGKTADEYEEYPLSEAENVVKHPLFRHDKTTLFIPDTYEPQIKKFYSHYIVDAYELTDKVNFMMMYWGTPMVEDKAQCQDIDIDAVIQMTTDFFIKLSKLINWKDFSLLSYAEGCVIAGNVAKQIYYQTDNTLRLQRNSWINPPDKFVLEGKLIGSYDPDDIVTIFSDTIHTNIGGEGTNKTRTHVDFFPNGGFEPQPGCKPNTIESRRRGFRLWAESVICGTAFPSFKADSYEDFLQKDEKDLGEVAYMGYDLDPSVRGKYYLLTNANSPFGQTCTR